MNLFQKGIILISIPLLFEIFLIVVLLDQNAAIDRENQRLSKVKSTVQAIFMVQSAYLEASTKLMKLQTTKDFQYYFEFQDAIHKIPVLVRRAKKLSIGNNLINHPIVARLLQLQAEVHPEFQGIDNELTGEAAITKERQLAIFRMREKMMPSLGESAELANKLIQFQWEQEKDSEDLQLSIREQQNLTLVYGLSFNVILAVALTLWLNQNTISRLQQIMNNATCIGKELPLAHTVSGNDEIKTLDTLLHSVSESLTMSKIKEREIEGMKEDFYAMVTHDLRSPLSSVGIALQLVIEGAKGEVNDRIKSTLELASASLERANLLINDFLDLKKLDAHSYDLNFENFLIIPMIEGCVETVAPQSQERGVTLTSNAQKMMICADKTNLSRVLVNLLTNAIKFSNSGGKVDLRVTECGDTVKFEVCDEGPGVPDQFKGYVFASFKQVPGQAQYQGTGLGLAICKLVVEQHGGEIGILDNKPNGSIFWFTIPAQHVESLS